MNTYTGSDTAPELGELHTVPVARTRRAAREAPCGGAHNRWLRRLADDGRYFTDPADRRAGVIVGIVNAAPVVIFLGADGLRLCGTLHGTKDTFVPIDSSRRYVTRIQAEARLLEIDGAQHGFAVHDDPQYLDPQTGVWQASVIRAVAEWLS